MAKIRICKEPSCKNAATTAGFCRLHYLKNWKRLKNEERRRAAKRLDRYIESIVRKHPDRYLEVIKKDLRSPQFEKRVDEILGFDEEGDGLFSEPAYDEDVRQLIEKLKAKLD